MFLKVTKAYETLADETKRAEFDRGQNAKKMRKRKDMEMDSNRKKMKDGILLHPYLIPYTAFHFDISPDLNRREEEYRNQQQQKKKPAPENPEDVCVVVVAGKC